MEMYEMDVRNRKAQPLPNNSKEIAMLEDWFRRTYVARLNRINRYQYLGLPLPESRYELELEAYEKEQKLRQLKGESSLPEIKNKNLL